MRPSNLLSLSLSAALLLALPGLSYSAGRHTHSVQPPEDNSAPATDSPWGVGAAYLPGPGGAIDALSLTYRGVPNWDFDGMLLGGSASGTVNDSFGGSANGAGSAFGIGAQARYGLLHPSEYLIFQLVGRLSYVTSSATGTVSDGLGSASGTISNDVFGIFVGAGFEGFFPFWRNVSVEVNSGINFGSESTTETGGGNSVSASGSVFGLGASNVNAFVPLNLAVHYYF